MIGILIIHVALVVVGLSVAGVLLRQGRQAAAMLTLLLIPPFMWGWYKTTSLDSVASWFYPADTEYAEGFSRDNFFAIAVGSERQLLTEILGPPLERRVTPEGHEYWRYSRAGRSYQNYWNYVVVVDARSGRVVELFSEFYVD